MKEKSSQHKLYWPAGHSPVRELEGESSPIKHEGESSASPCDRLSRTRAVSQRQLRRIMIVRFRPANISLINRGLYLPRLLLTLSSKRQRQKQPHQFADVDRVTPYQCPDRRPHGRDSEIDRPKPATSRRAAVRFTVFSVKNCCW